MDIGKSIEQYGVLIIGLLIGGGFAFGGIASYSSMIGGGGSNFNGQNQFNATLPQNNFQTESFVLSSQEQLVLAARNDVVFVNGLYETEQDLNQIKQLEGVEDNFNGRIYVHAVNYSETTMFSRYGFTDLPKAVVIGGAGQKGSVSIAENVDKQSVASAACRSYRNWNSLSAYCQGR
jgi:hypothetical protein